MDAHVRMATINDSPSLYALHIASVGCHECRHMYSTKYLEAKKSSFNLEMYKLNKEVLVAIKEETIVGFGRICVEPGDICELRWLFVLPAYFKMGVGTKLLCEMENIALSAKCTSIRVNSSLNAYLFYHKRGYKIEQILSDTLRMKK